MSDQLLLRDRAEEMPGTRDWEWTLIRTVYESSSCPVGLNREHRGDKAQRTALAG